MQGLAQLTGRAEWSKMAAGAVTLSRSVTQDGRLLPPDWAELTAAGTLRPEPAPDGSQPQTQYGPDAQRTVVWFAASCDPQARALDARWWPTLRSEHPRALDARWWPTLRSEHRAQALTLSPDGTTINPTPATLPLVAASAAAKAAGDAAAVQPLLRQAEAQQHSHPTYYGGAWSPSADADRALPVGGQR
jgi:hypothetical protein